MTERFLRKAEVEKMTGLHEVTIWRRERSGDFPHRIRLGPRAVGWLESEVESWMQQRAAARDERIAATAAATAATTDGDEFPPARRPRTRY